MHQNLALQRRRAVPQKSMARPRSLSIPIGDAMRRSFDFGLWRSFLFQGRYAQKSRVGSVPLFHRTRDAAQIHAKATTFVHSLWRCNAPQPINRVAALNFILGP
jgi:hypothetical protein